MNRILIAR